MTINMDFLNEVARDLPIIRPIKEFIHLNLLLPYQHLPFWEALIEVSTKLDAHPFPDLSYYRKKIETGELPLTLLRKHLEARPELDVEETIEFLKKGEFEFVHHDSRIGKLHECWNKMMGLNVIEISDGMLIKWLSMFMDQGIGHWQMPYAGEKSFYHCVKHLLENSLIKPRPFNRKNVKMLFPDSPEEAIKAHLDYLCPEKNLRRAYTVESIMTLRGWAGLIYNIQKNPGLLPFRRRIDLMDFLAIKLVLERAWIMQERVGDKTPDFPLQHESHWQIPQVDKSFFALKACQEVLEEVTFDKYITQMLTHQKKRTSDPHFQVVLCMDDRENSLRRFLEKASGHIETFGTPGHYGVECLYQHPDEAFPKKQCPAPMAPKVLLREYPKNKMDKHFSPNQIKGHHQPTNNFLSDWIFSYLDAPYSVLNLGRNLFFPLAFKPLKNVLEVEPDFELKLHRDGKMEANEFGLAEGYSIQEMAELVFSQLQLMGHVHYFAPLIVIIGHGSNSVNNPYFAAYGCGACSGRSGAANARAFSAMANHPEVRELIRTKYHLTIPESTYFVAAFHDTTRDVVELYRPGKIPETHRSQFKKFKKYLSLALYKNAKFRAESFKLVTYKPISKEAQKEVLRRSYSLYETRPELGHTGVAFAIVGRKELTGALLKGHQAFLQSYDPTIDADGKILASLLAAIVPVCSGISLDYYFSRADNLRFGAGSKLPQNIVGNFGVSHGTESDLLFGLPYQMIDQHQPLRLLMLVEQSPEIALSAVEVNPSVKQVVFNEWIKYACYDRKTDKIYFFKNGQMSVQEKLQVEV